MQYYNVPIRPNACFFLLFKRKMHIVMDLNPSHANITRLLFDQHLALSATAAVASCKLYLVLERRLFDIQQITVK